LTAFDPIRYLVRMPFVRISFASCSGDIHDSMLLNYMRSLVRGGMQTGRAKECHFSALRECLGSHCPRPGGGPGAGVRLDVRNVMVPK
jgi:hypothetical protein